MDQAPLKSLQLVIQVFPSKDKNLSWQLVDLPLITSNSKKLNIALN